MCKALYKILESLTWKHIWWWKQTRIQNLSTECVKLCTYFIINTNVTVLLPSTLEFFYDFLVFDAMNSKGNPNFTFHFYNSLHLCIYLYCMRIAYAFSFIFICVCTLRCCVCSIRYSIDKALETNNYGLMLINNNINIMK